MSEDIGKALSKQRSYFATGESRDVRFRIEQLKSLRQAIIDHEDKISEALYSDFKKPPFESYETEIGLLLYEISFVIRHLKNWAKRKTVATPLTLFWSRSYIYSQPYGVVLIISPWNYPFLLTFSPLIGAIAAGNCVVIKPSEISSNSSRVIHSLIESVFPEEYIKVFEGDRSMSQNLLMEKFDYIFFTGGTSVGRKVMEAAAAQFTPVTLELGGKSPCIVHQDADIKKAARRIVWGKFLNAGQTCVAPDYILAHKKIKGELLEAMKSEITLFYGENPEESQDYCRIINEFHFNRLVGLLKNGDIVIGGNHNVTTKYIAPTIVKNVSMTDPIMTEEIFGPVLPVLDYESIDEILTIVNHNRNPLALYLFTQSDTVEREIIERIPFGGGCINDTVIQFGSSTVALGGIGESGTGSYRGKATFDTFSVQKGMIKKSTLFDLPFRNPPYTPGKSKIVRFFMK